MKVHPPHIEVLPLQSHGLETYSSPYSIFLLLYDNTNYGTPTFGIMCLIIFVLEYM